MFEYLTIRLGMSPEEMTQQLNAAAKWEFMQALYNDVTVLGIFRRPKPAEAPKLQSKAQRRETRG